MLAIFKMSDVTQRKVQTTDFLTQMLSRSIANARLLMPSYSRFRCYNLCMFSLADNAFERSKTALSESRESGILIRQIDKAMRR